MLKFPVQIACFSLEATSMTYMKNKSSNSDILQLEPLEDRMMLSTVVEIFAAGETGEESFNFLVDGEVAQTFEAIGGDANSRDFVQLVFTSDEPITADQISIEFINDNFDPATGRDNNLLVDGIIIDGVGFETEAPTTFHTGLIGADGFTGPGFLETEVLNVNGTVSFLSDGPAAVAETGTRIRVDALGETGEEILQLQIDGRAVADFTFSAAGQEQVLLFTTSEIVDLSRVRFVFTNDAFDPATGADRNVLVRQFQTIDLESGSRDIVNTTSDRVFSNASFTELDGVQAGQGRGGALVTSDSFVAVVEPQTRIRVDAQGQTGEELLQVVLNGAILGQFTASTESQPFLIETSLPVDLADLQIQFVNDAFDPATGLDHNLTVSSFQTINLASGERNIARTVTGDVFSSGVFVDGQLADGFGRGSTLGANGFFQFQPGGQS